MKHIMTVGLTAALIIMAACTPPSLQPFYLEKNLLLDPNVRGMWEDSNQKESIHFFPAGMTYEFTYAAESSAGARFQAALFEIKGVRYLDLYPLDRAAESNSLLELTYIPAHILFRIATDGNTLRLAMLEPYWLKEKLAGNRLSLQHTLLKNVPVLTGGTEQIQSFLARYGDDPDAFPDWSEWRRALSDIVPSKSLIPTL